MSVLRERTSAVHQRLETRLDLVSPDLTTDRYRNVLFTMYGFYAVLEPLLDEVFGRPDAPISDWSTRRKLPRLRHDLRLLGTDDEALAAAPRPAVPPVREDAQALGALYVVEGATLGGQLIARHLAGTSVPPGATTFFDSYGSDVGRRWHQVRLALRAWTGGDQARAEACADAATGVFEALEASFVQ